MDNLKFGTHQELVEYLSRQGFSSAVADAFSRVDRRDFVMDKEAAYYNEPSALINNQTTSQPLIIGIMIDALELNGDCSVLEIGTGSGYQTVLISLLAKSVHSIEINEAIYTLACRNIEPYRRDNITLLRGNALAYNFGTKFDRIIVSACCTKIYQSLLDILSPDGIIVMPIADKADQVVVKINSRNGQLSKDTVTGCRFIMIEEGHSSVHTH